MRLTAPHSASQSNAKATISAAAGRVLALPGQAACSRFRGGYGGLPAPDFRLTPPKARPGVPARRGRLAGPPGLVGLAGGTSIPPSLRPGPVRKTPQGPAKPGPGPIFPSFSEKRPHQVPQVERKKARA